MEPINLETIPPKMSPGLSRKIYKVSELTKEIRTLLESKFQAIWLEGEISNFKRHSSGHMYFTLKDEAAQISAVFFAQRNQFLKFEPKDGLHVIAIGRISVYDARGNYQIYVERLEPKGLGALQLAFLQLKEKLEKEGLFDAAKKKEIPRYPKAIGIVTSPTGAAIQDMIKVFNRTKAGLHICLKAVRVQGDGSSAEIAQAIREFNSEKCPVKIDVMVIGRGGGSLEDLWAFNEEIVARAIFASQIPIISAVGHEIDWTISDLVADYRAHTPTAAAEHLVFHWNELEERLETYTRNIQNLMSSIFQERKDRLDRVLSSYAFKQPKSYLDQIQQTFDDLLRRMQSSITHFTDVKKHSFEAVIGKLNALSPLACIERGYSVTFDQKGKILKEARQTSVGETVKTRLNKGTIESKVTKIDLKEEK